MSHTGWVTSRIWGLIFILTRTHISAGDTGIQRGEDCGQDIQQRSLGAGLPMCVTFHSR